MKTIKEILNMVKKGNHQLTLDELVSMGVSLKIVTQMIHDVDRIIQTVDHINPNIKTSMNKVKDNLLKVKSGMDDYLHLIPDAKCIDGYELSQVFFGGRLDLRGIEEDMPQYMYDEASLSMRGDEQ